MTRVAFTIDEIEEAARRGTKRSLLAIARGRKDRYGYGGDSDDWGMDIEGVAAELAVAKLLDRYHLDAGDLDYEGDVGPRLQVRHSRYATARLPIHPKDPDDHFFVLVTGNLKRDRALTVRGGLFGRECKQQQWWDAPTKNRPAFFVP